MKIETQILLIILLVYIIYKSVEGLTTYNWTIPTFEGKVESLEVDVQVSDKMPYGYSSIPIQEIEQIDLSSINDMLDNSNKTPQYSTILDKLDDIEEKLLLTNSRYTCSNIYGSETDRDKKVYDCNDKILSQDILKNNCGQRGCSEDECCVDKPNGGGFFKFIVNRCYEITRGVGNQANENEKIYETRDNCENKNSKCSELPNNPKDTLCPDGKEYINYEDVFCNQDINENEDCKNRCCR